MIFEQFLAKVSVWWNNEKIFQRHDHWINSRRWLINMLPVHLSLQLFLIVSITLCFPHLLGAYINIIDKALRLKKKKFSSLARFKIMTLFSFLFFFYAKQYTKRSLPFVKTEIILNFLYYLELPFTRNEKLKINSRRNKWS